MQFRPEEITTQVERVVQSRIFETSEVHRKLLRYLAEKSLAGEAERLKEYIIGLEAFGKPPSYDPKTDSIVRLQVGRLRQKLTEYYLTDGVEDPVIVQLPKGAFKLSFEPAPAVRIAEPVKGDHANGGTRPNWVLVFLVLSLLWAAVATAAYVRLRTHPSFQPPPWNQELETLWAPFLKTDRPLLICLGTPMFARIPELGFFRDPKVNDWPDVLKSERYRRLRQVVSGKEAYAAYPFTGVGEAGAAVVLSKSLTGRKSEILLTRSNILSWQQIMDNDMIFVGPPKFNPQLETALSKADIVMEPEGIRNRKPRRGEPAFLEDQIVAGKAAEGQTHALITMMPGPSGTRQLLMIAGNASPDTRAAAEWLTEPWRARELVNHLREPSGQLPESFQVVLKISFKQGIPVESSYVFHHVLDTGRSH